jgi:hypothetical protein
VYIALKMFGIIGDKEGGFAAGRSGRAVWSWEERQ